MNTSNAHSLDHLLIVDDDADIRELLCDYLSRNGYHTRAVADGIKMREALATGHVDLIILDIMLPGEDGLTLCRQLRAHPCYGILPIIMLTARGDDFDRIVGLEMGADDYLPKPFNPRELLARIKTVLRRSQQSLIAPNTTSTIQQYCFENWTLDLGSRELIRPDHVVVPLSGGEFRLLKVLIERAQRVLNRDQLMDLTRGRDSDPFDRSIDVQISRLRQKLGDDAREPRMIKTIRGEGYVFSLPVQFKSHEKTI